MRLIRFVFGLRTKLLVLLLAFGAVPLAAAISIGYTVSRAVITDQAKSALRELTLRQAVHLATELTRQRLLLRTITAQLPETSLLGNEPPLRLAGLLRQSLPEDGVFDGLRLIGDEGRVVTSVALRNSAPKWPLHAPSADWTKRSVVVHREGDRVLAYVLAVPTVAAEGGQWLEGHVRAGDFARLFAMPTRMIGAVEAAIFERSGAPVFVAHERAAADMTAAIGLVRSDSVTVIQAELGRTPALVATAPIDGTYWVFAAALPLEIALAPLSRLRDEAIMSAAALVILIFVTGVLAARSVTTPLHELTGAARRFGKAGVYRSVPRRSADEVGLLVESFNRMAGDLASSREEIDRLHAQEMERAQQLATVGELASGVAHEIRNPLTGVLGALQLALRKRSEEDSSRPLLEEAYTQLERMEATMAQLLRYARPPELREVVVEANNIVERATQVVEPQAHNAGVRLTSEPSAEPVPVRVDPGLMVQVLVNLMLNGIEVMQPGGELTVWVARHAPEVWIGVRDTGPGIPHEERVDVFRPFYTTKHQGTGLGLSISRQIVNRHGGSLRVEDTPGGGATFVVALSLADEEISES